MHVAKNDYSIICATTIAIVVISHGLTNSTSHADSLIQRHPSTMLIIVASETHPSSNQNEFIVVQSAEGGAAWEATAIRPRHGAKMSGSVIPCTFDIKQLQNDLNNAVADTQAKLDVPATRFYSLLFVEEGQARANVSITAAQCAVLRTALRPIFDDILKNGPYAKPHIMLDLLMRSDAVRSFTESPRQ